MTEQSDKPSVDGQDALIDAAWEKARAVAPDDEDLRSIVFNSFTAGAFWKAKAERLAALAGPLEQPLEPKSDRENLAQASGVCDLQTALPKNDESEMARCLREAIDYLSDTDPDSEFIARCRAALGDA